jgi:homoserine kinase
LRVVTPRRLVVRAPATSANLGPGFDCLGLALDLWNEAVISEGAHPDENLILRAAQAVFEAVDVPFPGFELRSTNRIPFSRGLGSSAAAIVCGVLLGNHWLGQPLDQAGCLRVATSLEGHPDNVVPCLLGGARVASLDDKGDVLQAEIRLAQALQAVVFVPEHNIPTGVARNLLPANVPLEDALFNVARASLLVAALGGGRVDLLDEATRDRLHQPYRLELFPASRQLMEAARAAGALATCTSGAGPSVLALCPDVGCAEGVAEAMLAAARDQDVQGEPLVLGLTERGAHVLDAD